MQLALQPSPRRGATDRRHANLVLTLLFWAFTYGLFTYRANLRYGDAYELVSTIRLVSTGVGAGLYWLVLSQMIDGARDRPGKPLAVLATILPASIVVLLARLALDQMGATNPNGPAGDLRFVLVWGGYFGLWVSASFALRVMPRHNLASELAVDPHRSHASGPARTHAGMIARSEILERMALEIATLPPAERRMLLASFTVRSSYETADVLDQ